MEAITRNAWVVLLLCLISGTATGDVLQRCCGQGESWARNHTSCTGPRDVQGSDQLTCLTALYVCCVRIHRANTCENGKQAARLGQPCVSEQALGGDTYKDCCDGCTLGLQTEALRMPCSPTRFGSPWDEAFQDCCHESLPQQRVNRCERNNPCSQLCEDTGNQIICSCQPGFRLGQDRRKCEDIDECASGTHECNTLTETCINSVGGFECQQRGQQRPVQCPPGYFFNQDKRTCDDLDECLENVCPRDHDCLNSKGSFACVARNNSASACPPGFIVQPSTGRCVDVDECAAGIDRCDRALQMCQNSHGSYQCLPKPTRNRQCPAGFKWSNNDCKDVDECVEGLNNCREPDERCRNTVGGYECELACPVHQHFDPLQNRCLDSSSGDCGDGCSADEACVSGRCVPKAIGEHCQPGFKPATAPDGITQICTDVNECEEFPDVCDVQREICRNEEGRYECVPCLPGFRKNGQQCTDVDECADQLDTCDRRSEDCVNSNGSFQCVSKGQIRQCPPGYRPNPSSGSCEDINECLEGRHKCQPDKEQCQNVAGAYRCQQLTLPQTCPPGSRFAVGTGLCEDVNECVEGTHACDTATQDCINTIGSHRCAPKIFCPHGYRWNPQRRKCDDVNECAEGTDDCDRRTQVCVNTPSSYQCHSRTPGATCGTGFSYDATTDTCLDVNECDLLRPCQSDQTCENTQGSYRCACLLGYTLDISTRECKDVNECQLQLHSCAESQRCDNTIGSYTCVRVTSCGTGYTLNAGTNQCEDDDECELGTHNCGAGFGCHNTEGSFRCKRVLCPPGQRLLPDGSCKNVDCGAGMEPDPHGNCVDINECALPNVCRLNQRCINSQGSYRCQNLLNCGAGYELNEVGDQCVDVDECERRLSECGAGQTCKNRPGGYICECPHGYVLNTQRVCEDVDECSRFRGQVCASNSECINTQGSYTCNCKDGFRASGSDKSCVDIDECLESPNICQQTCNNKWGSYQCSCKLGYTLAPDERSCQDINECEVYGGIGNLCIGFCVNEPGSFRCSCPNGYKLSSDGRTCHDIDECAEQGVCSDDKAVCLNTRGGYKCNIINCPPNYVRDKDHRKLSSEGTVLCRKRCPHNDASCILNETQTVTFQTLSLPSIAHLERPLVLTTMRAVADHWSNFRTDFQVLLGDPRFDVLKGQGVGSLRLRLPISGPEELLLKILMTIYLGSNPGSPSSGHLALIHVHVSPYDF